MKFKNLSNVKFAGLLLVLAQNLLAGDGQIVAIGGGSGVGGGGDAVVFPDDTVVLADPFYNPAGIEGRFHCESGHSTRFSEPLDKEIRRLTTLMVRYGAAGSLPEDGYINEYTPEPKEGVAEFYTNYISPAEFCLGQELPERAARAQRDRLNLSSNANSHQVAYTEGNVTWINEPLFRRMSLREQAKTVIHERLHAFAGNVPHGPIADITDGLELAVSLQNRQFQGERFQLSSTQLATLSRFFQTIHDLRLDRSGRFRFYSGTVFEDYSITPMGGGLIRRTAAAVNPTAYIGIGSMIGDGTIVGPHVTMLNSQVCFSMGLDRDNIITYGGHDNSIAEGSILKNTWVGHCQSRMVVGRNVVLENSIIALNPHRNYYHGAVDDRLGMSIGSGSRILNASVLMPRYLELGENVVMSSVVLSTSTLNQWYRDSILVVGAAAHIRNMLNSSVVTLNALDSATNQANTNPVTFAVRAGADLDFGGQKMCHGAPSRPSYFEGNETVLNCIGNQEVSTVEQIRRQLCTQ